MAPSKVELVGLIVGIVGGIAGIVGAVAAVFAAKYAKESATQVGLDLVQHNTAGTTEQLVAVRGHMAEVDNHLRIQNDKETLDIAALETSITVNGEGWNDEAQQFSLKVHTQGVKLSYLYLISGYEVMSGGVACVEKEPGTFVAEIRPQMFAKWLNAGFPLPPEERRILTVKAKLEIGGAIRYKSVSVIASMVLRNRNGAMTYYYTSTGQC